MSLTLRRSLLGAGKLLMCVASSLSCSSGGDGATSGSATQETSGSVSSSEVTGGDAVSSAASGATTIGDGANATQGTTVSSGANSLGTTTGSGGSAGAGATGASSSQGGMGGAALSAGGANATMGGTGGVGGTGGSGEEARSAGCGATPTLTNSPSPNQLNYNTLQSGGEARQYVLRWPESYDNTHAYRLILGFHGATGDAAEVARNSVYFGLHELSEGSTIFIATEAVGGLWSIERDLVYVDDVLTEVLADLCIDTSRIQLEGFSQGGAMVRRLACDRPNVFSAAVAHSAGGLAAPESCEAIPYLGSLGLQENGGQETQTDFFAMINGCTVESLPNPPSGGHLCTDYSDCTTDHPVRWCPYDGGHTPSPSDSGQSSSWMPEEVWAFLSRF